MKNLNNSSAETFHKKIGSSAEAETANLVRFLALSGALAVALGSASALLTRDKTMTEIRKAVTRAKKRYYSVVGEEEEPKTSPETVLKAAGDYTLKKVAQTIFKPEKYENLTIPEKIMFNVLADKPK